MLRTATEIQKEQEEVMRGSAYMGNLQRTGEYHTRGVSVLHGVRWTLKLPGHCFPVAQDGVVYLSFSSHTPDDACWAVDARTGILLWRLGTSEHAAYANDTFPQSRPLIALTDTLGFFAVAMSQVVLGLDLKTGRQCWRLDLAEIDETLREAGGWIVEVAVHEGLLFLSITGGWAVEGVYAVEIGSKTCVWKISCEVNQMPPTISEQMLYAFTMCLNNGDGYYQAFDIPTRRLLWRSRYDEPDDVLEDENGAKILPWYLHNGHQAVLPLLSKTLYAAGGRSLRALDAQTGNLRWTCDHIIGEHVAVAHGLAYVVSCDQEGNDLSSAVNVQTHQIQWSHFHPAQIPSRPLYSSPLLCLPSVADGMLYLSREDGLVLALDAQTGEERWRQQLYGPIWQPCLVADGALYVLAGTTLYALY